VRQPDSNHPDAPNASPGATAASEGGDGTVNGDPSAGAGTTGIVTGTQSPARVAPWQSTTWANDCAAALQAVRDGSVPDSYRALVADYFDRQ
jgi:hypothetical protein